MGVGLRLFAPLLSHIFPGARSLADVGRAQAWVGRDLGGARTPACLGIRVAEEKGGLWWPRRPCYFQSILFLVLSPLGPIQGLEAFSSSGKTPLAPTPRPRPWPVWPKPGTLPSPARLTSLDSGWDLSDGPGVSVALRCFASYIKKIYKVTMCQVWTNAQVGVTSTFRRYNHHPKTFPPDPRPSPWLSPVLACILPLALPFLSHFF